MSHRRPMNIRGHVRRPWSESLVATLLPRPALRRRRPRPTTTSPARSTSGRRCPLSRHGLQHRRHHRGGRAARSAAAFGATGHDLVAVDGSRHGSLPGGHVRHPADPVRRPWRCSPAPPSPSLANATVGGTRARTPAPLGLPRRRVRQLQPAGGGVRRGGGHDLQLRRRRRGRFVDQQQHRAAGLAPGPQRQLRQCDPIWAPRSRRWAAASNIGASTEVNEPLQRGAFRGDRARSGGGGRLRRRARYRVDMCVTLPAPGPGPSAVFTGPRASRR